MWHDVKAIIVLVLGLIALYLLLSHSSTNDLAQTTISGIKTLQGR